ncbi:MAG: hypothetical protein SOR77_05920 [Peptoniphilus sp.]|uniref:hypothetical protein n=1 Tax=Peptoniphilus sp. TaxID=1971214 RepID=UPI002A763934|nr:hypothetical protein [Peptoniphilus sp.]MDY2987157.1 hypothetical protein [Peptoniphilus sp.]
MKKVSLRYRKFNKHKSEKIMRLLSKIKREKIKDDLLKKRKIISEFELPSDFRLFENYDIVMNFFIMYLKKLK